MKKSLVLLFCLFCYAGYAQIGDVTNDSHIYRDGFIQGAKMVSTDNYVTVPDSSARANGDFRMSYVNHIVQELNPAGEVIQVTLYDNAGKATGKYVYTYENGEVVSGERYDGNAQLTNKYTFGKNGRVIEEEEYGADGKVVGKVFYETNPKGQIERIQTYDAKGELTDSYTYTYGNNGERVNFTEYGMMGNPIGTVTYEYTYDDNGSWVKRVGYDQQKNPQTVTYRMIEYFK